MTSILSSVNQSDIIIDKQLSGVGGGGGNGGSGSGAGDTGGNYTTGTPPAIWFSYNTSSTHTIENSNASRHFADHPETTGAVGMEAIIIVVVVSLIPVSVIACMVFVISFNCLKRRSSLWSTTASPNSTENNLATKAQAQVIRVDGGGSHGNGNGNGSGRVSLIHSMMDSEGLTDAHLFNGERGQNDDQMTTTDNTPLSLIYPADAFCAAYMDASKSNLATPISNNSVITMTMRNNHLIVETEERIPCSLLDGQHLYATVGDGAGAQNTSNLYAQCQVEEYELNDDSLFDETDSFCENRYCQHGTTCVTENGCAFCDDYDYDDDIVVHNVPNGDGGGEKKSFYDTAATVAAIVSSTTDSRSTRMQTDEEDHHVQLFHKNIATAAAAVPAAVETERQAVQHDDGHLQQLEVEADANRSVAVTVSTGYSQSDAGGSSRHAQNHYLYGNQCEYVAAATEPPTRTKRFLASRQRCQHVVVDVDADAVAGSKSITTTPVSSCVLSYSSPPPPSTNSVHSRSSA